MLSSAVTALHINVFIWQPMTSVLYLYHTVLHITLLKPNENLQDVIWVSGTTASGPSQ